MITLAAAILIPSFWAPVEPPRAHYRIDVTYDATSQRLEGTSTIILRNTASKPLRRLAFRWHGDLLNLSVNGKAIERVPGKHDYPLFDLPEDLAPGKPLQLNARFGVVWPLKTPGVLSVIAPRLWWGFWTHDDYEVRINFPQGYAIGATGRHDNGVWRAKDVRAFGLFAGKDHLSHEADAGPTRVRVVHTEAGTTCADLLLRSAVDAVNFYRERFGSYPHDFLTVVPGGDSPNGGYPVATGLVVVHGQERLDQRPPDFWRWITAHEIGHQYFGEQVVARGTNSLDWLMIGLGLHADREFRTARGIKPPIGALWQTYVSGVREGLDTTMDVSPDRIADIKYDFNNVVTHGKSHAMLNALESAIGASAFDAAFRGAIREFKGKRLTAQDFRRLCEIESGQDLDWFFDQWTRTPRNVDYRVSNNTIERKGSLAMPVPILIRMADGSEQRATTERLTSVTEIAGAKEIVLDPDGAVPMAEAPPEAERPFRSRLQELSYTGAGDHALAVYRDALRQNVSTGGLGTKLPLLLYDGKHYKEALECFSALPNRFVGHVWRGHILDLLGRRDDALVEYQAALPLAGDQQPRYGQYKLTINKAWVEERIKSPFTRP